MNRTARRLAFDVIKWNIQCSSLKTASNVLVPRQCLARFISTQMCSLQSKFQYKLCMHASPPRRTFLTYSVLPFTQKLKVPLKQPERSITAVSRLGKRKTCKSVLKRFRRVNGGYLKRWRSGMVHKQRKKSSWRKFRLRGSVLVKNKTQLKTLNKMMYKY